MADNVTLDPGAGGATLAADDIAGTHHQRVKVQHGADGSATDVSTASPMPVDIRSDNSGGVEVLQDTAADLNCTEASAAAIKTAVEIIDDWDESDRCKSNIIVGQAGIAAGTGVDGATVPRVSLATDVPLPAGTNGIGKLTANSGVDIGDVDVTSLPADTYVAEGGALGKGVLLQGDDGTDRKNINVDATTGDVQVDVTNTVTVSGTVSATTAGDVASDSADSGNPVKTGSKAKNFDGTAPGTAVAEDDRVDNIADVYGRPFVETAHPNHWNVSADYAEAQTNTTVKAAPGAGLKLYITDIVISNGVTAGNITLLDGSGGTVLIEDYPAITGGLTLNLRTPISLTANTLLAITSTTVTTHSVTVCGYTAP